MSVVSHGGKRLWVVLLEASPPPPHVASDSEDEDADDGDDNDAFDDNDDGDVSFIDEMST